VTPSDGSPRPRLAVVTPDATPEEVAAIVAALGVVLAERPAVLAPSADDSLHEWVRAARLRARRVGMQRGSWRLSARVARRTRV
jgi:hypothetical protein